MTLKAEDFDVDGLTDEEREALAEGAAEDAADATATAADTADDVKAANAEGAKPDADAEAKAAADKEAADKKAADDKAAADKAAADAAAVDPAKKPAEGDKPAADVKTEAKPDAPRQAVPDWKAPADAQVKLDAIAAERIALAKKFDDGEITRADEIAAQMKLEREQRQIERALDRAQDAAEMTEAVWVQTIVPDFLGANPHYRDNPTLNTLLDAEVRKLQVQAGKDGKNPLAPSILVEADEAIKKSLGAFGFAPTGKAAAADVKPGAGVPKVEIPPSLAKIPAAGISDTDGKFSALDRLADSNPLAFEEAVGRMSEQEREHYLARAQ